MTTVDKTNPLVQSVERMGAMVEALQGELRKVGLLEPNESMTAEQMSGAMNLYFFARIDGIGHDDAAKLMVSFGMVAALGEAMKYELDPEKAKALYAALQHHGRMVGITFPERNV